MNKRFTLKLIAACAVWRPRAAPFGAAHAQTKLKWAHVYETSEPFHKWSVWAGEEIKKRTNGKYEIQVFPASSLGKESRHQPGPDAGHGGHHPHRRQLRRQHATRRWPSATSPSSSATPSTS